MRKLTSKDFKNLENTIIQQGHPIFFETKHGKFAIVLTDAGKQKFLNKGFIAIKLDELKEWLEDCKTAKDQKEAIDRFQLKLAEGFQVANKTKELFQGKVLNLEANRGRINSYDRTAKKDFRVI